MILCLQCNKNLFHVLVCVSFAQRSKDFWNALFTILLFVVGTAVRYFTFVVNRRVETELSDLFGHNFIQVPV